MTQLALAGHPGQIAWLEKYLHRARRGRGQVHADLRRDWQPSAERIVAELEAKALLERFGGVHRHPAGAQWAQNRFRLPLPARGPVAGAGYADTLETATSNVDGLLGRSRPACATAWPPRVRGSMCSPPLACLWRGVEHLYHLRVPSGRELCGDALERWKRLYMASQAIVDNGTISHQHGVGKDHAPYLPREKRRTGRRRAACHGRSLRRAGRSTAAPCCRTLE